MKKYIVLLLMLLSSIGSQAQFRKGLVVGGSLYNAKSFILGDEIHVAQNQKQTIHLGFRRQFWLNDSKFRYFELNAGYRQCEAIRQEEVLYGSNNYVGIQDITYSYKEILIGVEWGRGYMLNKGEVDDPMSWFWSWGMGFDIGSSRYTTDYQTLNPSNSEIETQGFRIRILDLNFGFERKLSQRFVLCPSVGLELGSMNMVTLNCAFMNWAIH